MSQGTFKATLIERVMSRMAALFPGGAVHDRNTSPEKSSQGVTISVYTPDTVNTHEPSENNVSETQLMIRYTGSDDEMSTIHNMSLAYIEDAVMDMFDQEEADPSGTNYKAFNVEFSGSSTSEEENMVRLDSILQFNFRYEYERGKASVI